MADLYEELGQNAANHDKPLGVLTGFPRIDECLLGLRPGQMIVIGARPGVGKTSFALNLMVNAAFEGAAVAMFSLEMSKVEIGQRLLLVADGDGLVAEHGLHVVDAGDTPAVLRPVGKVGVIVRGHAQTRQRYSGWGALAALSSLVSP